MAKLPNLSKQPSFVLAARIEHEQGPYLHLAVGIETGHWASLGPYISEGDFRSAMALVVAALSPPGATLKALTPKEMQQIEVLKSARAKTKTRFKAFEKHPKNWHSYADESYDLTVPPSLSDAKH